MTGSAANDRFWEDFTAGETFTTAGVTLSEGAIVDFALRYDPQPFHVDKAAAEKTPFGGLIASSWHVRAAAFRMVVQSGFLGPHSLGSPGSGETRYLKPVRPGDTISGEVEITEKRESRSRPNLGLVTMYCRVFNQHGEKVCSWDAVQFVLKKPAE